MSSAAQEEFDALVQANKDSSRGHPEDRHYADVDSPHPSDDDNDNDDRRDEYEISDTDSDYADHEKAQDKKMVSRTGAYTVPTTVFDANTGPKGVIADAQSFERAKKKSFRRTLLSAAGLDSYSKKLNESQSRLQKSSPPSESDGEEEFMRRWRESRLQELQERNQRRQSPSKRVYGTVVDVDAEGYLNAIERVSSETVVVVCIYNPESAVSSQVEDAIAALARRQTTTRFIKLHHEIAEMNNIDAPALLAYKAGDVISTIVDIQRQIPGGSDITSTSIENLLKQNRVL
ncbi:thioredoxin-like protein [Talaromyces proteolyticus]|uniref:Thioredoxin-like protein n=1 Tax=Talaromyces proteolyticus TaxID=1131652 RepID=A0AAD4KP73_9EURO|nr:thioredoxin-like protein [Talaromyces proteolyticus]KAH8696220.1 thioredoxin-like protein [Talaromyces proteolyticus]